MIVESSATAWPSKERIRKGSATSLGSDSFVSSTGTGAESLNRHIAQQRSVKTTYSLPSD
jgi:hypothetical protein